MSRLNLNSCLVLLAPNPGTRLLHYQHIALAVIQTWVNGMGHYGIIPIVENDHVEVAGGDSRLKRFLSVEIVPGWISIFEVGKKA
jgi:hypothetical protein